MKWGTPRKTNNNGVARMNRTEENHQSRVEDQAAVLTGKRKLNPLFVEWLMGLPLGWTAFELVEMGSYLSRQRGLLATLQGSWK